MDYDAVTLRNQSGEPVTFAHEATLRTFAHEGAIFVDVLGTIAIAIGLDCDGHGRFRHCDPSFISYLDFVAVSFLLF